MSSETPIEFAMSPVAVVRSPFGERFGIPRQPGLVERAVAEVRFLPPFDATGMLDALDGFSHVWLVFVFSACVGQGWRPRVRPPRLGGNREVGVWASRSPFRPNPIGLSAVRLLEVVTAPRPLLRVAGVDLLDGTPLLDVKPYLPYADGIPGARAGYATDAPAPRLGVRFGAGAEADLRRLGQRGTMLRGLIADLLALDPRPAYRGGGEPARTYGMRLGGCDVRWSVDAAGAEVEAVIEIE